MQMILEYSVSDLSAWRQGFDARSEARDAASLSVLQIWQDADAADRILCLFQCGDRKRVAEWLKVETALHGAGPARFLKVATA